MLHNSQKTNVLITLGILFTAGGALRMLPMGIATAETADNPPFGQTDDHEATIAAPSDRADALIGDVCFSGDAAAALQADLAHINQTKLVLIEREEALNARVQELAELQTELDDLHRELDSRWHEMLAVANNDLEHLAGMYSAMKPDRAAAIFDQMDPKFAAGFLNLMSSEQGGFILANMGADAAYEVSVEIASRNSDIR